MQAVASDVATFCVGMATGLAALLLAGGAPGKRFALPAARVVLLEASVGFRGVVPDLAAVESVAGDLATTLCDLLARHTGQTAARVAADTRAELALTAPEALAYGLVDEVLAPVDGTGTEPRGGR